MKHIWFMVQSGALFYALWYVLILLFIVLFIHFVSSLCGSRVKNKTIWFDLIFITPWVDLVMVRNNQVLAWAE